MEKVIAIASDDIGYERKEKIKEYLKTEKGYDKIIDLTPNKEDGINSFAEKSFEMSTLIQKDECRKGIYICGTGIGFTCQANKNWGIRAVPVTDIYTAKRASLSNNAQIIGLGARVNALEYMELIIDAFLDNPFDFENARENSIKNLLEAEKNDNKLLKKPNYVKWNMGFKPE